jgi:NADH:ubiquinone oxidoreductase subunit K
VLTNICASADRLRKECRRPGWKEVRCIIFYGFLVMLLWRVFDCVMFESIGEVFTAFVNNLGDLPPAILAPGLAVIATIAEFALGLALLLGIWRRFLSALRPRSTTRFSWMPRPRCCSPLDQTNLPPVMESLLPRGQTNLAIL